MAFDVLFVGACNVDNTYRLHSFPTVGHTVLAKNFQKGFGGKAGNQAISSCRVGGLAALISALGSDQDAAAYILKLKAEGVNVSHLKEVPECETGKAVILINEKGENFIVVSPNSNQCLKSEDIARNAELFSKSKVIVCQNEIDPNATLKALKLAKQFSKRSIWNPSPIPEIVDPEFFTHTDILCMNLCEALTISRKTNMDAALEFFKESGVSSVLVTDKEGVTFTNFETKEFVEAPVVEVVDSSGAGDAFLGSFTTFIAKFAEWPIKKCLEKACYIASQSVTRNGTQESFLKRSELPVHFFD